MRGGPGGKTGPNIVERVKGIAENVADARRAKIAKNQYNSIKLQTTHDDGITKDHTYHAPGGGRMNVTETPGRGITQGLDVNVPKDQQGKGWGDALLRKSIDDTHARGQVWHSDRRISASQVRRYDALGPEYNVKTMPHEDVQGEKLAHGDHVYEIPPPG